MGRLFSESHSITVMTWSRHVQNTYLYWVYSFPACYGLLSVLSLLLPCLLWTSLWVLTPHKPSWYPGWLFTWGEPGDLLPDGTPPAVPTTVYPLLTIRLSHTLLQCFFLWRYEPVRRTGKSDNWLTIFFARIIRFTVQKFQLFWVIFCIIIFFIELWHILILW